MGVYTGLRFKGIIKKNFRKEFYKIALRGEWESAIDDKIKEFSNVSRSYCIPCGDDMCYMPSSWEDDEEKTINGFDRTYNSETGYWTFQCCLKNYDDTCGEFFKLVPYLFESVEYCELFCDESTYSKKYDLVDGLMKVTNHKFIKYESNYLSGWCN